MAGLIDPAGDFTVVDSLQTVTLFRRTGTSMFDNGTVVPNALQRDVKKATVEAGGATLRRTTCRWHLWESSISPGADPKVGDVIQDCAGDRWTIESVDEATLFSRWAIDSTMELG